MQLTKRFFAEPDKTLLVINVVGAILYIFVASNGWANPEERAAGITTVTGEPFVWFGSILPIVTVFLLINLAWGVAIILHRNWQGARLWLLTAGLWLGAVAIDFSNH